MIEVYNTNYTFAVVVPDNEKLQLQEEQLHLERREALFASQEQRSAFSSTGWSALRQALRGLALGEALRGLALGEARSDHCGDSVNTLLTLL